MIRARRATAVLLTAVLGAATASCGEDDSSGEAPADPPASSSSAAGDADDPYQPTDEDRAEIRDLLDARAQALEGGDRQAFLATVDPADDDLVDQQTTLFENLQKLPVTSVSYAVDDAAGYPTAKVSGDDPLFRPEVLEQVRLDVDRRPVTNTLENTFVQRDGAWLLGAESVPGKYRDDHEPQSRPWAGTVGIQVARSGRLVVVTDLDGPVPARSLADDIADDIRLDAEALGMRASYDVLVDATTVGEAHEMNSVDDAEAAAVTFGVTNFAPDAQTEFAGMRIKVNPEQAKAIAGDEHVMRHELTHFLTLERLAGAPTWVKEGLAEWTSTAPATLDDLVLDSDVYRHVMDVRHRLPTGGRWGLDPQSDYLVGRAAVTHIVSEYGVAKVFEMSRAYGEIPGDDPDEKTDEVLQQVLGIGEAELVRQVWADLASMPRD